MSKRHIPDFHPGPNTHFHNERTVSFQEAQERKEIGEVFKAWILNASFLKGKTKEEMLTELKWTYNQWKKGTVSLIIPK